MNYNRVNCIGAGVFGCFRLVHGQMVSATVSPLRRTRGLPSGRTHRGQGWHKSRRLLVLRLVQRDDTHRDTSIAIKTFEKDR